MCMEFCRIALTSWVNCLGFRIMALPTRFVTWVSAQVRSVKTSSTTVGLPVSARM